MADIQIDGYVQNTLYEHETPRSLVWTSPTVAYVFYTDSNYYFVYSKTTDGGQNWGAAVTIKGVTATLKRYSIWFDKWTNGDSGDIVHMTYGDSTGDDVYYISLDTSSDTLGTPVLIFEGESFVSGRWSLACTSLIKTRGGNLCCGGWYDDDADDLMFYKSEDDGATWTSKAAVGDGLLVDRIMFVNGGETDTNDFLCIYQDVSANALTVKTYDDSANSWSESSTIDTITEVSYFFGFDAIDRHSDDHVILAMRESPTSGDLAVWDITDGSTYTKKTDVKTSVSSYGIVGLVINQQTDDLYVTYTSATTTGSIKYKKSTDGGSNWGSETALSATSDDHCALISGSSIGDSGGRFQPIWFNDDLNDLITNYDNGVSIAAVAVEGTNFQINIGDDWKLVPLMKINIGDDWKAVAGAQINIGDDWKTIF